MIFITRHAEETDLLLLAAMNKELIEDEGSRNPMDLPQLKQRMAEWLRDGWEIRVFEHGEDHDVIGYAVFCEREDDYDPLVKEIYVRQLYIKREMRSQGLGGLAIKSLMENDFPSEARIVIDVLASNPKGEAFWKRMGFMPYYTNMQLFLK